MYRLVDFRLSVEAPVGATGFPEYEQLQSLLERLDPPQRALFQLLRLGEAVDRAVVDRSMPPAILDAFIGAGLLVPVARDRLSTPSLILIPVENIFVLV